MRKLTIAAAMMLCILLSTHAFAQVSRLVENWQLGGIFSYGSGAPLSITASTLRVLLGDFPKSSGKVTFDSTGALYFEDLKQVPDPGSAVLCSNPRLEATVPRQNRANSVSWRLPILRAELFLRILLPENLALLARPGSRRRALFGWI